MRSKIVFCVRSMSMVGGKERAVTNMVNRLVAYYDLEILTLEPDPLFFYPLDTQIKITQLDLLGFLGKPKRLGTILHFFRSIRTLAKTPVIHQAELIIGNDFLINSLLLLAKWIFRFKGQVLGWEHLTLEEPLVMERKMLVLWRNFFYHRLSSLIVITQSDLDYCRKNKIKAVYIPHIKSFTFDGSRGYGNKEVLTIARLSYQKGLDLYLRVIENMKERLHGWKFVLVAKEDSISLATFRQMVSSAGLEEHLDIRAPQENVMAFYRNASIFLLTSRFEGLPVTLIEAQTCGLPCVSFDCKTGPAEIIQDEKDGFLIPSFDLDKMGEKLAELMHDETRRIQMGNQARIASRRFDADPIVSSWRLLINGLVEF